MMRQQGCLLLVNGLLASLAAFADEAVTTDAAANLAAKADFVQNVVRFVSWPESHFADSDSPLRLCVLGDPAVLSAFQQTGYRVRRGRPWLATAAPAPEAVATSCDVLYLNRSSRRSAGMWIRAVADRPVLTFAEADAIGGEGSIVTAKVSRVRVQFSIDLEATKQADLRISAQLLQLAAMSGDSGV